MNSGTASRAGASGAAGQASGPHGLPEHVAVVMDGNGRWAQARSEPRAAGHRAGVRALRALVEGCLKLGIPNLTVFAFSTENWARPPTEVSLLMDLFMRALKKEVDELHANQVRIRFIGEHGRLSSSLRREMARAETVTAGNTAMNLFIAVGYGGRADIVLAARRIAERVERRELAAGSVDESVFAAELGLASVPSPDLFIRTGGERRISNFLLWDLAYAELYFTDDYWPDFSIDKLREAVRWFHGRQRRFGQVPGAAAGGGR